MVSPPGPTAGPHEPGERECTRGTEAKKFLEFTSAGPGASRSGGRPPRAWLLRAALPAHLRVVERTRMITATDERPGNLQFIFARCQIVRIDAIGVAT